MFFLSTLPRYGVPRGSDGRVGARPAGQRWWQRSHHHLLLMGRSQGDVQKWQPSKQKRRGGRDGGEPGPHKTERSSLAARCVILPAPHPLLSRCFLSLHAPDRGFHSAQNRLTNCQQRHRQNRKKKKPKRVMCACVKVSFGVMEGDQRVLRGGSAGETQGLLSFSCRMYSGESSAQAECLNQSVLIITEGTVIPL